MSKPASSSPRARARAAGTGSAEQRVREQDQDGLDAEVLFPAMVAGPVFWRNISHDEVYKAIIRAYNDWLGRSTARWRVTGSSAWG